MEASDRNKNLEIDLEDAHHQHDILENKLRNYTENLAYLDTEKSELISKLSRAENEIKLLRSQVILPINLK
jgi:hypothetical protein